MIVPVGKEGPLVVAANLIKVENTFSAHVLISAASTGWELADNTIKSRRVAGLVHSATAAYFWLITAAGTIYELPGHGLGSAGADLWLGTAGAFVSTEPSSSSAVLIQKVARVIDSDHLLLCFDPPVILA